jgi:hypothetical protein
MGKKFDAIFARHKGPYTLIVYYPTRRKRSGYLEGIQPKKLIPRIEGEEVEEMACMLLTDPRDLVESVYVYSESEEQFVMGGIFRRHCTDEREEPELSSHYDERPDSEEGRAACPRCGGYDCGQGGVEGTCPLPV